MCTNFACNFPHQLHHRMNIPTETKLMDKDAIAKFYWNLPNGEKGRFTAYCSMVLGGSPHTLQNKFLRWIRGDKGRPMSPLEADRLRQIIETEEWRMGTSYNT